MTNLKTRKSPRKSDAMERRAKFIIGKVKIKNADNASNEV